MTKQNSSIIVIKAKIESKQKIKDLTVLLNDSITIGKVTQVDALDWALGEALKVLKNGKSKA